MFVQFNHHHHHRRSRRRRPRQQPIQFYHRCWQIIGLINFVYRLQQ